MNQAKYIGMDLHQATISVAVMDSAGKLILESILETIYLKMRRFQTASKRLRVSSSVPGGTNTYRVSPPSAVSNHGPTFVCGSPSRRGLGAVIMI